MAPSFSQVQYEKLRVREETNAKRIEELEAQVAALTRDKEELMRQVVMLRTGKSTCLVCKAVQAEVFFEGCNHLSLCSLCDS